jgi:hypothetical protein
MSEQPKQTEPFNRLDKGRETERAKAAVEGAKRLPKKYDERGRAMRVLASQGRAPGMVEHLPEAYVKRLAALCDETGRVLPSAPAEFQKILRELIDKQKAAVEGLEPKE